jgi:putative NADPH-quinone reductase
MREDQVNCSPILESSILLGFLLVLVALGLNPTIFRVSRASLDSINRLVNTEKDTRDFEEEFMALKEASFWVYSFPFYFYFIL